MNPKVTDLKNIAPGITRKPRIPSISLKNEEMTLNLLAEYAASKLSQYPTTIEVFVSMFNIRFSLTISYLKIRKNCLLTTPSASTSDAMKKS